MERIQEQWCIIEEFPKYSISNWGNIRNNESGYQRKVGTSVKGYSTIGFPDPLTNRKKKEKYFMVHRLVGKFFVDNPLNKLEINHIDGDKKNNYYKNLEWVTSSENTNYKINTSNKGIGETHSRTSLTNFEVLIICDMIKTKSFVEVDKLIGHPNSGIARCVAHGDNWSSITSHLSHIPYYKTTRFRLSELDVLIICEMYRHNMSKIKICQLTNIKLGTLNAILYGRNHVKVTFKIDFLPYQSKI